MSGPAQDEDDDDSYAYHSNSVQQEATIRLRGVKHVVDSLDHTHRGLCCMYLSLLEGYEIIIALFFMCVYCIRNILPSCPSYIHNPLKKLYAHVFIFFII